jgi:hypothetical protein
MGAVQVDDTFLEVTFVCLEFPSLQVAQENFPDLVIDPPTSTLRRVQSKILILSAHCANRLTFKTNVETTCPLTDWNSFGLVISHFMAGIILSRSKDDSKTAFP